MPPTVPMRLVPCFVNPPRARRLPRTAASSSLARLNDASRAHALNHGLYHPVSSTAPAFRHGRRLIVAIPTSEQRRTGRNPKQDAGDGIAALFLKDYALKAQHLPPISAAVSPLIRLHTPHSSPRLEHGTCLPPRPPSTSSDSHIGTTEDGPKPKTRRR